MNSDAMYCHSTENRQTGTVLTGLMIIASDIKVHGANMEPIWGRQDPGGPHVGPIIFAIWVWFHMSTGLTHLPSQ